MRMQQSILQTPQLTAKAFCNTVIDSHARLYIIVTVPVRADVRYTLLLRGSRCDV